MNKGEKAEERAEGRGQSKVGRVKWAEEKWQMGRARGRKQFGARAPGRYQGSL